MAGTPSSTSEQLQQLIDRCYPAGPGRNIFVRHSRQVADLALALADNAAIDVDRTMLRDAALAHDIGILFTNAPAIGCVGEEQYIRHGILGAALLRREGLPEQLARVAETHTGAGITPDDVEMLHLPLPPEGDYMPRTTIERLVCYADKFYSKTGTMQRKTFARARASIARHGGDALARFDAMARQFGNPDTLPLP